MTYPEAHKLLWDRIIAYIPNMQYYIAFIKAKAINEVFPGLKIACNCFGCEYSNGGDCKKCMFILKEGRGCMEGVFDKLSAAIRNADKDTSIECAVRIRDWPVKEEAHKCNIPQ